MFLLRRCDVFRQDLVVGGTAPRPQIHLPPQLVVEVRAEIGVRQEKDLPIGGKSGDQFFRIAAGAAEIDLGLGRRSGVHIRHDQSVGMFFPILRHRFRRRHVRHGTAGMRIGMQHDGLRRKGLSRLRHEPDAAEDDHGSMTLRRLARKFQRVADEIGDVLDLRPGIIMRQDQRLVLRFQCAYLFFQCHRTCSSAFNTLS